MTLTSPNGSSVYFIFFFIDFLSLSPITCSNDPNHALAISKADRQDTVSHLPEAVVAFFSPAVANVFCNHTIRIAKRILCRRKCNSVFVLILEILLGIPLETDFGHMYILSAIQLNCNINIHNIIRVINPSKILGSCFARGKV